jgi:hypothetical protein
VWQVPREEIVMTDQDRRDFLKQSAAAAAALGLTATTAVARPADAAAASGVAARAAAASQSPVLSAEILRAIGAAVLPAGELGAEGVERSIADFEAWIEEFQPAAEMPHGYLSRGLAEIRYGPEHPGPRWAAQAEELARDAEQRHGMAFAELSVALRRELIEARLDVGDLDRLPNPARAQHVALGLMAHFYDGAEATDICYGARIGRYRCRGLGSLGRAPQSLVAAGSAALGANPRDDG